MTTDARNSTLSVIRMSGLSVTAMKDPDRTVLQDMDWSVAPGDYWALAGLHGSGKSDFLMMTAGLLAPTRGEYRLFGETMPILQDSLLSTRLRLGLVFDGGRLFNRLTIAENVALPLRYHQNLTAQEAAERVRAVLEATELAAWADNTPGMVGRNWQRRAGLVRALMLQPEVLLLDDPLSGLDLRHTDWWLRFLGGLAAGHGLFGGRPMTLVVTTDSLRPWAGHARQYALLKDRRFVALGGWADVERSQEPVVREMLALGVTNASN